MSVLTRSQRRAAYKNLRQRTIVAFCGSRSVGLTDLSHLYICKKCSRYSLPPIYQCWEGHIICGPCLSSTNYCPTCGCTLGNNRNLILEKYLEGKKFPCKFLLCRSELSLVEKCNHELNCIYRPYTCLVPDCHWTGELYLVVDHLMATHKIKVINSDDVSIPIKKVTKPMEIMVLHRLNKYFLLCLNKVKSSNGTLFHIFLWMSEHPLNTTKYKYSLELRGANLKLKWDSTPRNLHDSADKIMSEHDTLMFHHKNIASLAPDGNLKVAVIITKKTCDYCKDEQA